MSAGIAAEDLPARPDRKTLLVHGGILVVYFMANLDLAVVSTSLPTIAGEFGKVELFGWVGAAYLLALAATSPFHAKLGDMFGRRTIVFVAVGLIAARMLQGFGAGGLTVSAYAVATFLVLLLRDVQIEKRA